MHVSDGIVVDDETEMDDVTVVEVEETSVDSCVVLLGAMVLVTVKVVLFEDSVYEGVIEEFKEVSVEMGIEVFGEDTNGNVVFENRIVVSVGDELVDLVVNWDVKLKDKVGGAVVVDANVLVDVV